MELKTALYEKFKITSFRIGQQEIISDVMNHKDVLAMLPTGSGKSLCYQLPALLLEGITIVISPLLSLMEDQVQQLKSQGIKEVVALNSFLSTDVRESVSRNLHKHKIIYASPEIMQSQSLQAKLKHIGVSLFVIDEAHCISQWGHEFRTDYLRLIDVRSKIGNPPCLALTATATKEVQQDIVEKLKLKNVQIHIYSVDRPNISLYVKNNHITLQEKIDDLIFLVKNLKGPGIIYVSTRKWTEDLSSILTNSGVNLVSYYHGGMNNDDRLLIQQQFLNDQLQLICCTSAFGMGVNKPNIRFVIHFHPPLQIESYLQEIGRAGRDGLESIAISLGNKSETALQMQFLLQNFPDEEKLNTVLNYLNENRNLARLNEEELISRTGITEVMWRFIRFQLEKHGAIDDNYYQTSLNNQENIKRILIDIIKKRIQYKQKKYVHFQNWLFDNERCKRKTLLTQFNEILTKHPEKCCYVCGLSIEDYFHTDLNKLSDNKFSWEKHLKETFHQTDEIG